MRNPLLVTKFHRPPVRPDLVPRPQLLEILNEALLHRLTSLILVSAPAGFGKTTLVTDWLSQINRPAAWVSLDKDDNDPVRFWRYVIGAMQTVVAALGQTVQAALDVPPAPESLGTLIAALINDLDRLNHPFILVLDDYHLIDCAAIHESLNGLLDRLPPQICVVITTRVDPPWRWHAVEGTVFVGSWDGFIYAVDAQSGQEAWHFDASTGFKHIHASPTIVDGVVYIGGRTSYLFALDAQSGEQIWAFRCVHEWVESSAAVADSVIYVGSSADARLYAIDRATGELKWYLDTVGYAFSSPAVSDGVVYMGSVYSVDFLEDAFFAVTTQPEPGVNHLKTTDARWCVEVGPTLDTSPMKLSGVVSSPMVSDGVVYFGGLDGKLYAVSTAP